MSARPHAAAPDAALLLAREARTPAPFPSPPPDRYSYILKLKQSTFSLKELCSSSSTANGIYSGTSVSGSISNGLRVAAPFPVPFPNNGLGAQAAGAAGTSTSLAAEVDCSETDGCHMVLHSRTPARRAARVARHLGSRRRRAILLSK